MSFFFLVVVKRIVFLFVSAEMKSIYIVMSLLAVFARRANKGSAFCNYMDEARIYQFFNSELLYIHSRGPLPLRAVPYAQGGRVLNFFEELCFHEEKHIQRKSLFECSDFWFLETFISEDRLTWPGDPSKSLPWRVPLRNPPANNHIFDKYLGMKVRRGQPKTRARSFKTPSTAKAVTLAYFNKES